MHPLENAEPDAAHFLCMAMGRADRQRSAGAALDTEVGRMPDISLITVAAVLLFAFVAGFGWTVGGIAAGWVFRRRGG